MMPRIICDLTPANAPSIGSRLLPVLQGCVFVTIVGPWVFTKYCHHQPLWYHACVFVLVRVFVHLYVAFVFILVLFVLLLFLHLFLFCFFICSSFASTSSSLLCCFFLFFFWVFLYHFLISFFLFCFLNFFLFYSILLFFSFFSCFFFFPYVAFPKHTQTSPSCASSQFLKCCRSGDGNHRVVAKNVSRSSFHTIKLKLCKFLHCGKQLVGKHIPSILCVLSLILRILCLLKGVMLCLFNNIFLSRSTNLWRDNNTKAISCGSSGGWQLWIGLSQGGKAFLVWGFLKYACNPNFHFSRLESKDSLMVLISLQVNWNNKPNHTKSNNNNKLFN